jgi:hypothetical protein
MSRHRHLLPAAAVAGASKGMAGNAEALLSPPLPTCRRTSKQGMANCQGLKKGVKKIQNGHQFNGRVIRIVRIEALHAIQSMVDILGCPIWWCDVGHCVAVLENFVPPESVCIKSVL